MRQLLLVLIILFSGLTGYAQTITSTGTGGAWNATGTWVGGVIPTSANSSTVVVAGGATVTVPASYTATANSVTLTNANNTSLVIANGGTLSFNNILTLGTGPASRGTLVVNGVLQVNQGATMVNNTGSRMTVNATGIYRHNYTTTPGTIYGSTSSWQVGSTVEIVGYTSNAAEPTGLNQSFRNFVWNCPNQSTDVYFNTAALTTVLGNFTVTNTNGYVLGLTVSANSTLTIQGNLSIAMGSYLDMTGGSGNSTINLRGDFTMSDADGLGNFGSGVATLRFTGLAAQNYNSSSSIFSVIDIEVVNSSILRVSNASFIETAGTFTLDASSVLQVGSTDPSGAIQTGTSAGNIRVPDPNRFYNSTSTIVYNGTGAQFVGDGFPSNVNLEINNSSGVTNNNIGVTNVVGNLILTSGSFNVGSSNTLNIQSNFIVTGGTIGGGPTANLTFSGSGTLGVLAMTPGTNQLNNLTVSRTATLVLGSNLTVGGVITLSFGNLDFSGYTLTMNGSSISASGTGLISNSSSNLVFGGSTFSGAVPFLGSTNELNNLTFSTPGGVFNWNSHVIIQNRVTLSAGTINHTSGLTMGSASTFSRSGGSLLLNDPDVVTRFNVEYTGGVTTGLELPATPTELNNFTVNSSGPVTLDKSITINGNVNLLGSTFGANGFDVTLASPSGTWTRNGGGFIGGSGVLTVAGNYTIVAPSSTPNYTNITINNSASLTLPFANVNIGGNIVNNGTLNRSTSTINFNNNTTISGSSATTLNNITVTGTLIAPAATTLGIAGNFTNNGTFNHNNGTVAFSGTTAVSGSAASNFFHVNLTGTLTAPSATSLGIAGNWTNSGTFNHNNGTVLFNGTVAAQTVSGSSLVLNNLRVSNPVTPGVNINNTTRLNGICTLTAGAFFDADGTGAGVFIVSSSSQIAGGRIAALPTPANFTGQVTIERYVHGKTGGDYRYLSMPITTNANVGIWRNSLFVTGNFSDRNTNADNANINDSGNMNASVYTYNPATNAYVGVSGGGGLTTATPLSSRTGYSVYDFNNGPVTVSYRGLPEKGSVPITISNTAARFNLVPNPYPSPIDWDNVTKTNVTDAMYIRIDNNVFSSYVGGVSTNPPFVGWTGEVAIGQAFFVVSSGSGTTFTLTEASKSNNAFYFLRERTPDDYFRIKLHTSNDAQDEVVIRFAEGATDQFDSEFDAPKMWMNDDLFPFSGVKPYANMASYLASSNDAYSINTIDLLKGVKIVRLTVSDIVSGKNTLTFSELDKLTQSYNIVLVDNYLQKEYNVSDGFEHEFTVSDDKASLGSARFHLRINGAPASDIITATEGELFAGISVYPNPVVDKVTIELSAEQQNNLRSIELVSMLGVPVVNSENNKQLLNAGVKTIDMGSCASGVYLLNIKVGDRVKSIRILKK